MSLFQVLKAGAFEPDAPQPKSRWLRARRRTFEILEKAEPGDEVSRAVDAFLILMISVSVITIILESIDGLYLRYKATFFWLEVFTIGVFTIEYVFRFWCSVESAACRAAKKRDAKVRIQQMFTAAALIDLIAILPFYLTIGGLAGNADLRFLRAIRLLRVLKLTRYSAALDTLTQACKENAKAFAAAFFILIVVMLIAATGMYFFEREAQPVAFASIPASMWWAFSTLTTVGYGDVTPITVGGKVFGALITVVGVGMVALPTGILASAYSQQLSQRSEEYRRQADMAYADGMLSATEEMELEQLRQTLGLAKSAATQILDGEMVRAAVRAPDLADTCPHCGAPTVATTPT